MQPLALAFFIWGSICFDLGHDDASGTSVMPTPTFFPLSALWSWLRSVGSTNCANVAECLRACVCDRVDDDDVSQQLAVTQSLRPRPPLHR